MKNILYILSLILLVQSCGYDMEEKIDWKLDKCPDMLVVQSIITNETKHQEVFLTITNDYYDTNPVKPAHNATVNIVEGLNTYTFTENDTVPGLYCSDIAFAGEPLKTYELRVTTQNPLNGLKDFTATSTMPKGIDMDSIICELYKMPDFGFGSDDPNEEKDTTILVIYQFGYEPKEPGNYYFINVYWNQKPLQKSSKEYPIFSDDFCNGDYTVISSYIKNVKGGDSIRYRLYSVEKGLYKFLEGIGIMDQLGNSYSMSGPPANAIGNVSNGKALGFFAASYISEKKAKALDRR